MTRSTSRRRWRRRSGRPLSSGTNRRKTRRGRSGSPPSERRRKAARRSRLRNSIRAKSDASGFTVGTNTIYASTHQLGEKGRKITIRAKTSKGLVFKIGDQWIRKRQVTVRVKIPARPFLGLSEDDLQEIKGTLEDALGEE